MKRLVAVAMAIVMILPALAHAEIKIVTHTVQQPFGGSQSPDDARTAGIARAKREALERFGSYIESTTIVKDSQVDSDEILALTAGVTKAEVVKQKNYTDGDGFGLEITVKVELDTTVLNQSLKRLLQDRNHLKDLKAAREREKKLLARVAELEKQNQRKGKSEQQKEKLKKEFQKTHDGLTAVECFDKAMALWDGHKILDMNKAIEFLTIAIQLDPSFAEAYSNRSIFYLMNKDYAKALDDINKAIQITPNDGLSFANRGFIRYCLNDHYEAINDYNKAYTLGSGNDGMLLHKRGLAYNSIKQFDSAIADFNESLKLDNDKNVYISRGITFYNKGDFVKAIDDFDVALKLDSNFSAAYYHKAMSYIKLNKLSDALANLTKAIEYNQSNTAYWGTRGTVYKKIGNYQAAIDDYSKCILLDPQNVDAYVERGYVYNILKKPEISIADSTIALALNPNDVGAHNNKCMSLILLGKLQDACLSAIKACELGDCRLYKTVKSNGICS